MRYKAIFCSVLGFTLILSSCSKTKFSGFRQYTTNFTSYYNTYFNIKQLYKVGYRESVFDKQESTSEIISVFEYENDPQLFEASSQFKGTAVKVGKLLSLRPYNKWMDDAILVEGKIRYLKGDLDSAIQFLSYLVDYYPKGYMVGHLPGGKLKGFDDMVRNAVRAKEPIHQSKFKYKFARNEGIIWLAKAFIKKGSLERALNLILRAEADMGFPVEYRKDLMKVRTMLSIEKKDYPKAVEYINVLLSEHKLSTKEKARLYFILGQISEKDKKYSQASQYFAQALSSKLKNDLEFEARLRMLSYTAGGSSLPELKRMLNKGKYEPSLDKIYFAIGNVLMDVNQIDDALVNYQKAIGISKNSNQKFLVYMKVGSIFYDKTDYVKAAKYYDSAQRIIPQNYPNKKEFMKKVEALNKLLIQYDIYVSKDSILNLAALGPEKAKEKIEKEIKKAYEAEKANELFLETQVLNSQSVASTALAGTSSRQWYFSSKESIDKGRVLFQKKWGKLQLKENWHRSSGDNDNTNNKGNSNSIAVEKENSNEPVGTDLVAEIEAKKLPFSAEDKRPYKKEIQQALIAMARLYNYEIKDIAKAIETYEILFKKYNDSLENEDEHLYSLFRLLLDKEDADSAEKVKSELISKYPNSKYALYSLNPNAKSQEEKSDLAVAKLYKEAYSKYQKTYYSEALDMCNSIIEQYSSHSLIPKVKLLKAFIYSYTLNSDLFVKTLEDIIANNKDSEEAKSAKEYLDIHLKQKGSRDNAGETAQLSKPQNSDIVKENTKLGSLSEIIQTSKVNQNVEPVPSQIDLVKKEETKIETKQEVKSIEPSPRKTNETIVSENVKKTEDGLQIVNYTYKPESKHALIFKLSSDIKESTARNLTEVFLKTNFKGLGYKSESLDLNPHSFITISGFKNVQAAIEFYKKMQDDALIQKLLYSSERFYISSENLDILYISVGWDQYLSFYEKNYK